MVDPFSNRTERRASVSHSLIANRVQCFSGCQALGHQPLRLVESRSFFNFLGWYEAVEETVLIESLSNPYSPLTTPKPRPTSKRLEHGNASNIIPPATKPEILMRTTKRQPFSLLGSYDTLFCL